MKCVCIKACQTRTDAGHIKFFAMGDVALFKKCPEHFRPIEGTKAKKIDFATAGEQELREAKYDTKDLKKFIELRYKRKPGNRGKDKLIDMLLDSRFRELDIDPNDMV